MRVLFNYILESWRNRPLLSRQITVNQIGSTTTDKSLQIMAKPDKNHYKSEIKVTDVELKKLIIIRNDFHSK